MWNLNNDTNELFYETETDSQTTLSSQQRTDLPRGRDGVGFGDEQTSIYSRNEHSSANKLYFNLKN